MDKRINVSVNTDIYDKFCMALNLTNETEDFAINECMRWYIAKAFEKASYIYDPTIPLKRDKNINKDFYGKAIQRIPIWALKPTQYNHKIIRAFFKAVEINGNATIDFMEELCSDKDNLDMYVPTFKNNYSQMKIDGPKSHGKVFEDDGRVVKIWDEVKDILMKYKASFS